MTEHPDRPHAIPAKDKTRSVRPVIEHALTAYGYSPDTARTLIDRLIAEPRPEGGQ